MLTEFVSFAAKYLQILTKSLEFESKQINGLLYGLAFVQRMIRRKTDVLIGTTVILIHLFAGW